MVRYAPERVSDGLKAASLMLAILDNLGGLVDICFISSTPSRRTADFRILLSLPHALSGLALKINDQALLHRSSSYDLAMQPSIETEKRLSTSHQIIPGRE